MRTCFFVCAAAPVVCDPFDLDGTKDDVPPTATDVEARATDDTR